MEGLIADYNEALNRIRRSRVTINNRSRQNDVNRILYSMGKELNYDSDSLYSAFAGIDDENKSEKRKELHKKEDREEITAMLNGYLNKPPAEPFRDAVIRTCIALIENKMKPSESIPYAVALGKRSFMWDVLCEYVEETVLKNEESHA